MVQIKDSKGHYISEFDDYIKQYLVNNYHKKPLRDIAKTFNVCECTIRNWRRRFTDIKRKSAFIKLGHINDMSDIDLAYIAGIVDGEGNISMNMFNNKLMYPRVYITNTYKKLMDYLLKVVGTGNVRMHMEPNLLLSNRKPAYIWGITEMNGVRNFLTKLLPFLLIKKEQAELSIEQINIREKMTKRDEKTGRFLRYTPFEREWEIYNRMKVLNKRGLQNEIKT